MAHSVSAKKRVRQNTKARARNRWRLRTMRDALKDFQEQMMHGTYEQAEASFKAACAILDKTASKGVIHKNQAGRRKSRMASKLKARNSAG